MKITPAVFEAYLKCPTKCWLRATGKAASGNAYAEWVDAQNALYRATETARLAATSLHGEVMPNVENIKAVTQRLVSNWAVQTQMDSCALESELHMVDCMPGGDRGKQAQFIPIRFVFRNKLTKDDRLLLAFDALVLSKTLGHETSLGKIIHGDEHVTLKVKTSALSGEVRNRLGKIAALLFQPAPPDLVLNRHCAECEFQARCRQKALEQDDLSLLTAMSAKERDRHRGKGIFTVTQLSYTFRPRRTPKRAKNPAKPRYLALQALAIRENTVYIHGTPVIPRSKTHVYLDIEGLPDRDFHYLIGALIVSDGNEVFHSFWAETQANQSRIFAAFIETINQLEDFQVFHFGDYEAIALRCMKPRLSESHGKQLDLILGKCTNVLSAIYSYVYFPTFSNNLKVIGEHLNATPSALRATGLDSITWRSEWERCADSHLKARLVDYNESDCLTLRKVTEFIAFQISSENGGKTSGIKVSRTDDMNKARPRWQMFAPREYTFKELAYVTKCSYFDYQREKVLVRTDRQLRKINKKHRKLQRTKRASKK